MCVYIYIYRERERERYRWSATRGFVRREAQVSYASFMQRRAFRRYTVLCTHDMYTYTTYYIITQCTRAYIPGTSNELTCVQSLSLLWGTDVLYHEEIFSLPSPDAPRALSHTNSGKPPRFQTRFPRRQDAEFTAGAVSPASCLCSQASESVRPD